MSLGASATQYSSAIRKIDAQKGSCEALTSGVLVPYRAANSIPAAKLEDLVPSIKKYFGIDFTVLAAKDQDSLRRALT